MADTIETQINDLISNRAHIALLLDFDGTLVDLVPHPEKVDVPPELAQAFAKLIESGSVIFAIVTGRSLAQLDKFLGGVHPAAMGNHGAECRISHGGAIQNMLPPVPDSVLHAVMNVGERHACYFENKVYTLSLHLPFTHADEDIREELAAALGQEQSRYHIRRIGRTYEIMPEGIHKGNGIAHLMKQPGYAGRKPVYIGDDAAIDESLHLVTDMGGTLIPARHIHHQKVPPRTEGLWETEDVRALILKMATAD